MANDVGQVRMEGASSDHVEDLNAPADGQDRKAAIIGRRGDGQLGLVAVRVDAVDARVSGSAVGGGVQVPTAGQNEGVEPGHHCCRGRDRQAAAARAELPLPTAV